MLFPVLASASSNLPEKISLSPFDLFKHADFFGKTIIILLLLASLFSWIVWVGKLLEIRKKNNLILQSIQTIEQQRHLVDNLQLPDHAANLIYQIAKEEYEYAQQKNKFFSEQSIKERVIAVIERIVASEKHHLSLGTSFLATVGAIAPFVGLLGTVWGIMNSFVSIAQSNTSSLSVVAPGIAEALFATALGLFAAIPAVILYNSVVRSITHHTLLVEDNATSILNLLSRDLEDLQGSNLEIKQFNKDLIIG
ncbi:MAG: Biopolymer transport protein ExbB [Acinetobacter bereziniae]|uniref:Biopolymer transport protein ExbB n=1 Tax=Acinetobacter bereziniae TaxID=106648 RepID=A0A833PCJ8_ACIBZ|nr:MAG: Biopolymer transport protein ExbB [Acinetobacter bereziniae]